MENKRINPFKEISEKCIACPLCRRECAFLERYGNPKEIADRIVPGNDASLTLAFECSLCGLCGAVCPVDLKPRDLFLEMRREAVKKGIAPFPGHKMLLDFERRGTSRRYSYYALPAGCDTIFFPGCGLPGTRPKRTLQVTTRLRSAIPNLGIVLDCCTKPSHDLGRHALFEAFFREMKDYLLHNGVRTILTACPNCYRVFKEYGGVLRVRTVYEVLAEQGLPINRRLSGKPAVIHDPCSTRNDPVVHEAARFLITNLGLSLTEMPHYGVKTLCCGEGGAAGMVAPDLAGKWGQKRKAEAEKRAMVTYCVGCSALLNKQTPVFHLLDLAFEPEAAWQGKIKAAGPPWTYWNRIKLKKDLNKIIPASITRERSLSMESLKREGTLR